MGWVIRFGGRSFQFQATLQKVLAAIQPQTLFIFNLVREVRCLRLRHNLILLYG